MKLKLKTLSIEIERGMDFTIGYRLKVNEIPVGKAEPYILWNGEANSPEVVRKETYIYPILGFYDVSFYFHAEPMVVVDKENNDEKTLKVAYAFTGIANVVKLTRLTINNPNKQSIIIHSISYPPKLLGITVNYPDQTGEIFNPDVPNFFLFLREGDFVGDVLGAHELYTYEIPPQKMIQINLFYETTDGKRNIKVPVTYEEENPL